MLEFQEFRKLTTILSNPSLTIEKKLECILEYIVNNLNFDGAEVFLFDGDTQSLKSKLIVTKKDSLEGEGEIQINNRDNPLVDVFLRNSYHIDNKKYTFFLPLYTGTKIIGVLQLNNRLTKRKVKPNEIQLLLCLCELLSWAVYSSGIDLMYHQQANELIAISDIVAAINKGITDLNRIFEMTMQFITQVLKFDQAELYLFDPEQKIFVRKFVMSSFETLNQIYKNSKYQRNKSIDHSEILFDEKVHFESSNYWAKALLKVKNEIFGILIVNNVITHQKISHQKLKILEILIQQVCISIENANLLDEIKTLSITDELTKLYNYRHLQTQLKNEILRAKRFGYSFSLLMLDIDYFKNCNDTYGHLAGDAILAQLATLIRETIREVDFPARYGGEEFAIILPFTTPEEAKKTAERILLKISAHEFLINHNKTIKLTVSIGCSSYPHDATSQEDLIKKSDEALYWVKTHGRNQVCLYSELK